MGICIQFTKPFCVTEEKLDSWCHNKDCETRNILKSLGRTLKDFELYNSCFWKCQKCIMNREDFKNAVMKKIKEEKQ